MTTQARREALAEAVRVDLRAYTLAANVLAYYGDQTHDDVASRCAPLIADALLPLIDGWVAEAEERGRRQGLTSAAAEIRALDGIGKMRRDQITEADWDWFTAHPLQKANHGRLSLSDLIPAVHGWLMRRGALTKGAADEGVTFTRHATMLETEGGR